MDHKHLDKVSAAGLLIALGIIYGDIGTSPLYVMQAIMGDKPISERLVLGAVSCVLWTLTLLTTVKYVVLILRADNRGEGGVFALYTLVRKHARWLTIPAIIGGAALLADGIITPPMSVASAVEGLEMRYPHLDHYIIYIILAIITVLFLIQALGTQLVGRSFGPMMFIWFSMLAFFGIIWIAQDWTILRAVNPYYAYDMLAHEPSGFWLLGSVFLCSTGAEALYSDMGHCGRGNIRVSWVFVKACLMLQYFGQGAWLMAHNGEFLRGRKPIYEMMPDWFLLPGITIATMAAIIASQALITGSFTLISEAIRLNFWPKVKLRYPSNEKGQLYVPSVNWLLWAGCMAVVLYFRESTNMEAAYGLAITLTMLMTTMLMAYYLYTHRFMFYGVILFLVVYLTIESSFLVANLLKFTHGGWVSLLIGSTIAIVMIIWLRAFNIKARLTEYVKLSDYIDPLKELSRDMSIPKYATHLIFMSNASRVSEIESKVIYSIFQKRPKRADIYWFVHVDTVDDPYTMEYKVNVIAPDDVIKVTFRLGFRVEQRINLYFRRVIQDMVKNKEVDITSRYESLSKQNVIGDFRFVVLEKFLSFENDLPFWERMTMQAYFYIKTFTTSEDRWFGLDSSAVKIEKVPLIIRPAQTFNLKRVTD
ncbi:MULTISPECIES: KUP/HAK/KT family potassium transporter [unclassified Siphonobacter]|uniref:KUP/HAK/KT family potassium transporter n=1 Tax=unclassified Siphonobacter TaxID=2635712 RepID=UPI000CB03890|nr:MULTISPECIES: KUP/HAK/KT family potassium transporter [unclassified Siphonobacter]MDQ1087457.1 KUP system potassium uptake protein [Siphonobacter sp. SORGH_AS_1065]MDR6193606.1 KUP system potassium uptake protein [Siphonobacter sp. SORGH_AS_0500]PKK36459.1 potassium transporter Kup [Siphonobacter sp. SORGH_AS_0500]